MSLDEAGWEGDTEWLTQVDGYLGREPGRAFGACPAEPRVAVEGNHGA